MEWTLPMAVMSRVSLEGLGPSAWGPGCQAGAGC